MHGLIDRFGLSSLHRWLPCRARLSLRPLRDDGLSERLCRRHELHGLHRHVLLRLLHDGSHFAKAPPCRADGVEHGLVDGLEDAALVLEFELTLLRVHVDINRALRHLNAEDRQWESALRDQRLVGIVDGLGDCAVLDDARIDDVRLPGAAALEHRRLRDVAGDLDVLVLEREPQERVSCLSAIDGLYRVVEVARARRHDGHLVVVDEVELDVGTRERELDDEIVDARALRVIRLEEFLARRRIEEEVLYLDRRADIAARLDEVRLLAARDGYARAEVVTLAARQEREARDGRDRRQGLAAEAQRADGIEVTDFADLARRMAQDREVRILRAHAPAIVRHAHEARAARHDLDLDAGRARIHRILDELLDDRRRPLHDFASRNLVDGIVVKYMDHRHALPASLLACSCRR